MCYASQGVAADCFEMVCVIVPSCYFHTRVSCLTEKAVVCALCLWTSISMWPPWGLLISFKIMALLVAVCRTALNKLLFVLLFFFCQRFQQNVPIPVLLIHKSAECDICLHTCWYECSQNPADTWVQIIWCQRLFPNPLQSSLTCTPLADFGETS